MLIGCLAVCATPLLIATAVIVFGCFSAALVRTQQSPQAKSFASGVDASDISKLVAKMSQGSTQVEITLSLETIGRLRAERFTHFTDGSGRTDYSAVDYFQRGRRPCTP